MPKRHPILHIGQPKTGTFPIQRVLGARREQLAAPGVCDPVAPSHASDVHPNVWEGMAPAARLLLNRVVPLKDAREPVSAEAQRPPPARPKVRDADATSRPPEGAKRLPKAIDDGKVLNNVEAIGTPAWADAPSGGCHRTSAWLAVGEVRTMLPGAGPLESPAASKFKTVSSIDAAEFTASSRISSRLPGRSHEYDYLLRDRALWRMRFNEPIFAMASRSAGTIEACFAENRFSTEVRMSGDESSNFVVVLPRKGAMTLLQDSATTTAGDSNGLVVRPSPRAQVVFSDAGGRANLCFKGAEVEETLRHTLDRDLRRPLEFAPRLDWTGGLALSFRRQLDAVFADFLSLEGMADNPVALAAMTDLLLTLLLRAADHNYTDQLDIGAPCAVPVYVRRAEEFMRANCTRPIRVAEVAAAAGCSVRNLNGVFRRFRGTTPLAALHACRLEEAHAELSRGAAGGPIGTVARRYGFTNPSRFGAAFRRRFGEAPSDVVRRASRP